jgi:transcriptional regulator with XRE-family HTH domain
VRLSDRIRSARGERGLSQKRLAEMLDVRQATVSAWEKGVASPREAVLHKLADAVGKSVSFLRYGDDENAGLKRIEVIGDVKAGAWRTALEFESEDREVISVPAPARAFSLIARGESMNQRYPDGTYLICLPITEFDEIKNGAGVIVHRSNAEGLWEATVKEYRVKDRKAYLWPRSDHPDFQTPLLYENGESVEITAIVVGTYRPE